MVLMALDLRGKANQVREHRCVDFHFQTRDFRPMGHAKETGRKGDSKTETLTVSILR